jgi:hypothetical protein
MITHYDMQTGEVIGTEEAYRPTQEALANREMLATRLLTIDEAISEVRRSPDAHPAVVMLPIAVFSNGSR